MDKGYLSVHFINKYVPKFFIKFVVVALYRQHIKKNRILFLISLKTFLMIIKKHDSHTLFDYSQ